MRREMVDNDELVAAAQEGRAWAAHALVTTVAPVLLGYAALVGRGLGSTDHELAVEAAIARGVRKLDQYDPNRGTFAGWLRPFVRHALDDIRRNGAADSLSDDFADAPEDPPSDAQTPQAVEERKAINRAVASLRPTDQLILHLRNTEVLTYEQCAERIGGVTAGACRVRHHRAVRRLADAARTETALAHYFEEVTT
jgi:RNA polymerase sigma factor (sigma-70 family)